MIDLARDSATFFHDFREVVSFRTAPAAPVRTINANVHRSLPDEQPESSAPFPGRRAPIFRIEMRNHATKGVIPAELVADVSEFEVAYPLGAVPRWRKFLRIIKHNAGLVLVEVQS